MTPINVATPKLTSRVPDALRVVGLSVFNEMSEIQQSYKRIHTIKNRTENDIIFTHVNPTFRFNPLRKEFILYLYNYIYF